MAIKMDKTSIIVCSVIGSLGLLSAILGFSAEGTKLTLYTILVYGDDCLYPQNPAIGLGICAAIFLIVAQVTFSAVSGCCGCCRSRSIPSETKRIVGIVCAVFSWIAAVIAFALFIEGAAWNANVVRVGEAPFCPYLKDGVFAGAGVLALAAAALAITSFIMLRAQPPAAVVTASTAPASAAATPNNMPGAQSPAPEVVIGRPLLPPSGKPPSDYPVKPQQGGHEHQQQPPPAYYAQAPQNAPPAAAQPQDSNVSHAPIHHQQLPPRPAAAAAAAPAVGVVAASVLQPAVAMGQPVQYSVPVIPAPQMIGGGVDIAGGALPFVPSSAPPAPAAGSGGSTMSTAIRNEMARQGVKLAAEVVRHSLFSSDNNSDTVGDGVLSMMAGSAGGDGVQAAN